MIKNILIVLAVFSSFSFCEADFAYASEIPVIEPEGLSDKDMSPTGKAALSFDKDLWKHAESAHFVYHFTDNKEAETIYINAEVYYEWIKELFGVKEDKWSKKNHIFIFSDEKVWKEFNGRIKSKMEGDAFTNGWELFIYRNPYWLAPKRSLAHEITHVVIFRFLDGPLPLFLNEGFAEFISARALAMQLQKSEYEIRPLQLIAESEFIPLKELINMDSYPQGRTDVFYRESGLLARFLIFNYGNEKFYELLREASKGEDFQKLVSSIYEIDLDSLEGKFKAYALSKS